MTLIHKTGDIFTTEQPAVIHGVNVRGAMGAGIAKTVRKLYPDVYTAYRERCLAGELKPGQMFPFFGFCPSGATADRWVLNAASQDDPGPAATYEWLQQSLVEAFEFAWKSKLSGLAICQIGCGYGGLEWPVVLSIIEKLERSYPKLQVEVWTFA